MTNDQILLQALQICETQPFNNKFSKTSIGINIEFNSQFY